MAASAADKSRDASTTTRPNTPAQIEDQSIQLHREFVAIVCVATGMLDQLATPIATAIRTEFDGTNAAEVCKKHGIGRSRLYKSAGEKA